MTRGDLVPYDIDVRRAPRGWAWRIFRFEHGRMELAAVGTARFAWMARVDSRRFLTRRRAVLLQPTPRFVR